MNILIVEDEPRAAAHLAHLIRQARPGAQVTATIDSVKRTIEWLEHSPSPDLIFMDIELGDGRSFEVFEQVAVRSPVVFTTAYDEFALRAFKVNSIDYLLKPVTKEDLIAAFTKYDTLTRSVTAPSVQESIGLVMQMLAKKYKERFIIKTGERLRQVNVKDILFFFSLEKATFAQTNDGRKHILDFTLDQIEGLVDPAQFFRINRKYVVCSEAIHDMVSHVNSRLKLLLRGCDDKDIIVARERVQLFREWLDR